MPHDMNKPCILLDLDQTLISGEPTDEMRGKKLQQRRSLFKEHDMSGYYYIYERPHLQEFLDYVFKHFNVSIFTAASKDYALFIAENIILNGKKDRKLDYIFFSYHTHWSKSVKKYSKELCMLWDTHKLDGYNAKNTVIVDDYKTDVHKCQPANCIIAPPFEFKLEGSQNDTFLLKLIDGNESPLAQMEQRIKNGDSDLAHTVNVQMNTLHTIKTKRKRIK